VITSLNTQAFQNTYKFQNSSQSLIINPTPSFIPSHSVTATHYYYYYFIIIIIIIIIIITSSSITTTTT